MILDEDRRVLLLHYVTPDTGEDFWGTPGGAMAHGESPLEAARRELREELGINAVVDLGPTVWRRRYRFTIGDGRVFLQNESYHVMRLPNFEPIASGLSDFERQALVGHRWWTLDELRGADATLSPPELPILVARLVAGSPEGDGVATRSVTC